MTEDGGIEEMISKGVHQDVRLYSQRFQKCPLCRQVFNQSIKPKLLNCGHLICAQCLNQSRRCCYPECKNTNPSIKPYSLSSKEKLKENQIFKFVLGFMNGGIQIRREFDVKMTIGKIMQESLFQAHLNKFGLDKTLVILNSNSVHLHKIINSRIIDLASLYKLSSKANYRNSLRINERYNGGLNN